MDDNYQPKQPNAEPQAQETPSEQPHTAPSVASPVEAEQPAKVPKKSNKKKLILLIILVVALLGASAAAYFLLFNKNEPQNNQTTQTATEENQPNDSPPTKLVYAYQEANATFVRELDIDSQEKTDVLTFTPIRPINDLEEFMVLDGPEVAASPDQTKLAYVSEDGLWTAKRDGSEPKELIAISKGEETIPDLHNLVLSPDLPKSSGGPSGVFNIFGIEWSLDGSVISFLAGFYEGVSAFSVTTSDVTFDTAGDRFRYVDETTLGEAFNVVEANQPFKERGVLPSFLLLPQEAISPVYSADTETIYAILCPPDLPESGNSTYIEGAGSSQRRDCGEDEPRQLITIDSGNGVFTTITEGQYDTQVVRSGENLYTISRDNQEMMVYQVTGSEVSEIDLSSLMSGDEEVVGSKLSVVGNHVLLTIYYQKGSTYSTRVIDVTNKTTIGDFEIAKVSAFTPLAYY